MNDGSLLYRHLIFYYQKKAPAHITHTLAVGNVCEYKIHAKMLSPFKPPRANDQIVFIALILKKYKQFLHNKLITASQ